MVLVSPTRAPVVVIVPVLLLIPGMDPDIGCEVWNRLSCGLPRHRCSRRRKLGPTPSAPDSKRRVSITVTLLCVLVPRDTTASGTGPGTRHSQRSGQCSRQLGQCCSRYCLAWLALTYSQPRPLLPSSDAPKYETSHSPSHESAPVCHAASRLLHSPTTFTFQVASRPTLCLCYLRSRVAYVGLSSGTCDDNSRSSCGGLGVARRTLTLTQHRIFPRYLSRFHRSLERLLTLTLLFECSRY